MEERMKILEMLQNGTITVNEANELLKTLDNAKVQDDTKEMGNVTVIKEGDKIRRSLGKVLHIEVESSQGDEVNVKLPISFIRTAIKAGTATDMFKNSIKNDAANQIDFEIILHAIDEGMVGEIVSVSSATGDEVKIYIE